MSRVLISFSTTERARLNKEARAENLTFCNYVRKRLGLEPLAWGGLRVANPNKKAKAKKARK